MFSVRIVSSEYHMSDPIPGLDVTYSSFRGAVVKKVPVIRIFGPCSTGQKTCLNIHGVFPYICIPCDDPEPGGRRQYQLASSLDLALNISMGQASSSTQHVFKVALVTGIPFYGYHEKPHQFFKIYFYNPAVIKKASELLQSGAILSKVYQVHESHVPFMLQFFIDYNLRGMDFINLETVKYRQDSEKRHSTSNFIDEHQLLPESVPRLSVSELEVDGIAADIINNKGMILDMNPGLVDIWEDEKQRRREEFRVSQISPLSSQQRPGCQPTESELFFRQRLQENLLVMSSGQNDSSTLSPETNQNTSSSAPYPAEAPEGCDLPDSSFLDTHIVSTHIKQLPAAFTNETIVDEDMVLSLVTASQRMSRNDSMTMDSQDLLLADILEELAEGRESLVDEDSILGSQIPQNNQEDDLDLQDLSQPFDGDNRAEDENLPSNTSCSLEHKPSTSERQTWEDSYWSGVDSNCLIPQLDGALESSPENTPEHPSSEGGSQAQLTAPINWSIADNYDDKPVFEDIPNVLGPTAELANPNNILLANDEDLMDLSYTIPYNNTISVPFNKVLIGDDLPFNGADRDVLSSPMKIDEMATTSGLQNILTSSFLNFEDGMETLNFSELGEFLEPPILLSPQPELKDAGYPRITENYEVEQGKVKAKPRRRAQKKKQDMTTMENSAHYNMNSTLNFSEMGEIFESSLPPFKTTNKDVNSLSVSNYISEEEQNLEPLKNKNNHCPKMDGKCMPIYESEVQYSKPVNNKNKLSSVTNGNCFTSNGFNGGQTNETARTKRRRKSSQNVESNLILGKESVTPRARKTPPNNSISSISLANYDDAIDSAILNGESVPCYIDQSILHTISNNSKFPTYDEAIDNAISRGINELACEDTASSDDKFTERFELLLSNKSLSLTLNNIPVKSSSENHSTSPMLNGVKDVEENTVSEYKQNMNIGGNVACTDSSNNTACCGNEETEMNVVKTEPVNLRSGRKRSPLTIKPAISVAEPMSRKDDIMKEIPNEQMSLESKRNDDLVLTARSSLNIVKTSKVVLGNNESASGNVNQLEELSVLTINQEKGESSAIAISTNSIDGEISFDSIIEIIREAHNSPNPIRFTFTKDMGVPKYEFQLVEILKKTKTSVIKNETIIETTAKSAQADVDQALDKTAKTCLKSETPVSDNSQVLHTAETENLSELKSDKCMTKELRMLGTTVKKVLKPRTGVLSSNEDDVMNTSTVKSDTIEDLQKLGTSVEKVLKKKPETLSFSNDDGIVTSTEASNVTRDLQAVASRLVSIANKKEGKRVRKRSSSPRKMRIERRKKDALRKIRRHQHELIDSCQTTSTRTEILGVASNLSLAVEQVDINEGTEKRLPSPRLLMTIRDKKEAILIQPTASLTELKFIDDNVSRDSSYSNSETDLPLSVLKSKINSTGTGTQNVLPNLNAFVRIERLSEDLLNKYVRPEVSNRIKIPCLDGGIDSDSSSSDECNQVSLSQTPVRRKRSYQPLTVTFEKSPKAQSHTLSPGLKKKVKSSKRGLYNPLDIKFEKSPSQSKRLAKSDDNLSHSQLTRRRREEKVDQDTQKQNITVNFPSTSGSQQNSSNFIRGITTNINKLAAVNSKCVNSQSLCDAEKYNNLNQSETKTKCDDVNIDRNQGVSSKTAKKKLSFSLSSIEGVNTKIAGKHSSDEPMRRSSVDPFSDSNSSQSKFASSGEMINVVEYDAKSSNSKSASEEDVCRKFELLSDDDVDDVGIVSFYNDTHVFTSQMESTFYRSSECNDDISSSAKTTDIFASPTVLPLTYVPIHKPPTRQDVISSLSEFNIPEYQHQEPFYSDPSDVTSSTEVGHRTVKLAGNSVEDLQPFESCLTNVVGLEMQRSCLVSELNMFSHIESRSVANMRAALASQREVVLTPCNRPPTFAEVERWEKARKLLKTQHSEEHVEKTVERIYVPSSQDHADGSDTEILISLTPESPPSLTNSDSIDSDNTNAHSTPHHSMSKRMKLRSPIYTPILNINTKSKLRKKSIKFQNTFKPSEPSIDEVDENIIVLNDLETPSTSKETSRRLSQTSNEDQSLHKLLLKSQFRQQLATPRHTSSGCQIEGVSNNTYGFRMSYENLQDAKAITRHQYLTILTMELHVQTRGELKPDPAHDSIRALFYVVVNDVPDDDSIPKQDSGVIVVNNPSDDPPFLRSSGVSCKFHYVADEKELLTELVAVVGQWDPDIFAGYEVEMLSWGYLLQRAAVLEVNLCPLVSRVPTAQRDSRYSVEASEGSVDVPTDIKLVGRIMLNVWRLMKSESALMNYSFENVIYHTMHQRVALHSFKTLTHWWEHPTNHYKWIVVEYYLLRVNGIIKLMDQLDLIGRTSELARLFGIQFYEVLSRGTQFRVESMMLRLTKPLNYIPVSPSIQQRAQMKSPECVPLIMEPESKFYADPVIVLDFQSLYPSIMIAYNYCFSTCLGRVEHLGKSDPFVFGCTQLKVPPLLIQKLTNSINIAPCGVAFVKEDVRKGVLPRMLQEILETRLMVKKSMKEHKDDKTLQRVLHSRQLGLKLIANVTYGYTSANFSGRMPCIEVGDSVVSKGRETLERAIRMVEMTKRWGAKVVYGDTDSLFVLVKGRSREQAFKIGAEIADAVTKDNPKPVKLKLEKVYHPCILQTKKRYVGYLYETANQLKPTYDAKGIETVRRDGCPAVAKMLEKCLQLVFETRDVSIVKKYVCRQFDKLLQGRTNLQDLIYAREYRGMASYRPGACVPALELTRQWLRSDKRAEPRVGERVPYIIVNGPPGLPLIRLVRSPHDLMTDPSLKINATYYITRAIIPPLHRCFSLMGADIHAWYAEMPRKMCTYLPSDVPCGQKKSTISQYFVTMNCVVCGQLTNSGICTDCQGKPQTTVLALSDKLRVWERSYSYITKICESCCGRSHSIECKSLDCPILFRKYQATRDLEQAPFVRRLLDQYTF